MKINAVLLCFAFLLSLSNLLGNSQLVIETNTESSSNAGRQVNYITASQYCDFLNQAAITDPSHLYHDGMGSDPAMACIVRLGEPGKFQYQVIAGREDALMTYVNRHQQALYRHWIENHQNLFVSTENRSQEEISDDFLACNNDFFRIEGTSIGLVLLTLSSTAPLTSSEVSTAEEVGAVVGVIGVLALCPELMLRRSNFQEALTNNPEARRLIVTPHPDDPQRDIIKAQDIGERSENIETIRILKQALQDDGHTKEEVDSFVSREITPFDLLTEPRSRMSAERLQRILDAADANKEKFKIKKDKKGTIIDTPEVIEKEAELSEENSKRQTIIDTLGVIKKEAELSEENSERQYRLNKASKYYQKALRYLDEAAKDNLCQQAYKQYKAAAKNFLKSACKLAGGTKKNKQNKKEIASLFNDIVFKEQKSEITFYEAAHFSVNSANSFVRASNYKNKAIACDNKEIAAFWLSAASASQNAAEHYSEAASQRALRKPREAGDLKEKAEHHENRADKKIKSAKKAAAESTRFHDTPNKKSHHKSDFDLVKTEKISTIQENPTEIERRDSEKKDVDGADKSEELASSEEEERFDSEFLMEDKAAQDKKNRQLAETFSQGSRSDQESEWHTEVQELLTRNSAFYEKVTEALSESIKDKEKISYLEELILHIQSLNRELNELANETLKISGSIDKILDQRLANASDFLLTLDTNGSAITLTAEKLQQEKNKFEMISQLLDGYQRYCSDEAMHRDLYEKQSKVTSEEESGRWEKTLSYLQSSFEDLQRASGFITSATGEGAAEGKEDLKIILLEQADAFTASAKAWYELAAASGSNASDIEIFEQNATTKRAAAYAIKDRELEVRANLEIIGQKAAMPEEMNYALNQQKIYADMRDKANKDKETISDQEKAHLLGEIAKKCQLVIRHYDTFLKILESKGEEKTEAEKSKHSASVIEGRIKSLTDYMNSLSSQPPKATVIYSQEETIFQNGHKRRIQIINSGSRDPYVRYEEVIDAAGNKIGEASMIADQLLVRLKDNLPETREKFLRDLQYRDVWLEKVLSDEPLFKLYFLPKGSLITKETAKNVLTMMTILLEKIKNNESATHSEPNFLFESLSPPNDTCYSHQWNLKDFFGITPPSKLFDQNNPTPFPQGDPIIVAIIDSGIKYDHEDYCHTDGTSNLWSETDTDGDVIYGYNALEKALEYDPYENYDSVDQLEHGTFVSGIIGAASNNKKGIAGIAGMPGMVKIMACKGMEKTWKPNDPKPYLAITSDNAIKCIKFAREKGAKILNCSWGHYEVSQNITTGFTKTQTSELKQALDNQGKTNALIVVCSAGNDQNDNDTKKVFPASYSLPNVVAVAATTENGVLAKRFSNYGEKTVHIASPGVNIKSTSSDPKNLYKVKQGTSFAAPHVTAAIALLMRKFSKADIPDLIKRLLATTDPLVIFDDKNDIIIDDQSVTKGRLNLFNSLKSDLLGKFGCIHDLVPLFSAKHDFYEEESQKAMVAIEMRRKAEKATIMEEFVRANLKSNDIRKKLHLWPKIEDAEKAWLDAKDAYQEGLNAVPAESIPAIKLWWEEELKSATRALNKQKGIKDSLFPLDLKTLCNVYSEVTTKLSNAQVTTAEILDKYHSEATDYGQAIDQWKDLENAWSNGITQFQNITNQPVLTNKQNEFWAEELKIARTAQEKATTLSTSCIDQLKEYKEAKEQEEQAIKEKIKT